MATLHTPDKFVLVKHGDDYHVVAGWGGGYTTGSSWRVSTPINIIEKDGPFIITTGNSGTQYKLHENALGRIIGMGEPIAMFNNLTDGKEVKIIETEEELEHFIASFTK